MIDLNEYLTEKLHIGKDIKIDANSEYYVDPGEVCCAFKYLEGKYNTFLVPEAIKVESVNDSKITFTYVTDFTENKGKTVGLKIDKYEVKWKKRGLFCNFDKRNPVVILNKKQALEILEKAKDDGASHFYTTEFIDIMYVDCPEDYNQRRKSWIGTKRPGISLTANSVKRMSEKDINILIDELK
jgi:hypothetical protein